jgi:hypothetical protein
MAALAQRKRYYAIDHKLLFLFGFVFYLVVPVVAGMMKGFVKYPGMDIYHAFFDLIPQERLVQYLVSIALWPIAFFCGHLTFSLLRPYKLTLHRFPANYVSRSTTWVSYALFLVLILFVWLARGSVSGNYQAYDSAARGKLSTLLMVYDFFLLYQWVSRQRVDRILILGLALNAAFLLFLGGRLYVFQTFTIVLIFMTSFADRRWKPVHILALVAIGFVAGSLTGVLRMGYSYTFDKAAYTLFAEPVFTWFSTGTFLISNDIPMTGFPTNFLTSFFNLVPNTFVNLQGLVVTPQNMGYRYLSLLGADSIWTTSVVNFGYFGSLVFVYVTGFLLHYFRMKSESSRFWAVYYILLCGLLPFQFFRDSFAILNKQIFFNFLLLPGLLLLLIRAVQFIQEDQVAGSKKTQSSDSQLAGHMA